MNCFGLGVFLGKTTFISLCSAWRNSAVTFSFTWLLNPLHFNLFTIYANQYFRYVSCLSTEEWSHSARWLQAFAELVIFVLLTLKSHWRGRWTTSVNNICLYFYKKVYIFPRKWSCRFYVKCIFYDMGHVFPWKWPWEFVCELYFSIFFWDELCICLKNKDDIFSLKIIMRTFEL